MNTWKKVLIVALCVLAVGSVASAVFLAYDYYEQKNWDNSEERSVRLSENIVLNRGRKSGKHYARLRNTKTGRYTTPVLSFVYYNPKDTMLIYTNDDDEHGYLNMRTGKIAIPAQYDDAWNFSEGLAAVYKDGAVSFITPSGEAAFQTEFPILYVYEDEFKGLPFYFRGGLCLMRTIDSKWGLIDKTGEWAVEPVYHSIDTLTYGYRRVFDGEKYGLLDINGTVALPVEYDDIHLASESHGFVLIKDGVGKEVDTCLNTTIPFVYDYLEPLYGFDSEEGGKVVVPSCYMRYSLGDKQGVIDMHCNVIIPALYYDIVLIREGLFEVKTREYYDSRCFVDTKGQYVTPSASAR